ncbi:MAG: c-type cytochrome [Sphingobium sp.]
MIPLLALVASPALAGTVPEAYKPCAACHDAGPSGLGPDLKGVVGRPAGNMAGFRYSGPLKRSGIVWSPEKLRAFLVEPQNVIPGNRMPFAGIPLSAAAEIVAYLQNSQGK